MKFCEYGLRDLPQTCQCTSLDFWQCRLADWIWGRVKKIWFVRENPYHGQTDKRNTIGHTNSPVLGLSGLLYCLSGRLSGLLYCYWVCPAVCPAYYTAIGFVRPTVLRFCPAYCIAFLSGLLLLLGLSGRLSSLQYCVFVRLSVVRIFTDKPYFFLPYPWIFASYFF
jgi:hypothetical protein